MSPHLARAGQWLLRSGIQEPNGGVARYYRADLQSNFPVSTEITGYFVSTLVYLHTLTRDEQWLLAALRAARFLTREAWNAESRSIPFEVDPPASACFFDTGIVIRGLLSAWRATGEREFLDVAASLGQSMAHDFACQEGAPHPAISLPGKVPAPLDAVRWSASPGCYQLKAAMAWWDLAEATGAEGFRDSYQRVLEQSLRSWNAFLPGHPDCLKVMDRLHAFAYFLEGLLPCAHEARCAAALSEGIRRTAQLLGEIAPTFERADVYAQLLRIRLFADWTGAAPLDREAAQAEADKLAEFQAAGSDTRIDGGYYFGRKGGAWLPYVNPVTTAFALQALELWERCLASGAQLHRHLLI